MKVLGFVVVTHWQTISSQDSEMIVEELEGM